MIFDIIVIAIVLISALHAFWRGFIREVLTIFGAIGGVVAAIYFGDDFRPMMDTWMGVGGDGEVTKLFNVVPMPLVSAALAYGAVFIVVFGVLSFISHLIAEQARALGLGAVDRTLGVVFGIARAALILGIFYLPVHLVMEKKDKEEWFKESKSHIYVEGVAVWLESVLPEDMLVLKEPEKKDGEKDDGSAREKLEKIDLLKHEGKENQSETTEPVAPASSEQGYEAPARQIMDKLIEKGIEKGTEALSPPPSNP